MTIAQILQACVSTSKVQIIHECLRSAKAIQRTKAFPAHTRIEIATTGMTPNDALYFSGQLGRPECRTPEHVGILVWVPFATYKEMTERAE